MGHMRSPLLSLHGIEGAFYGVGAKTVIPTKVSGTFSICLVPPRIPDNVDSLVIQYLRDEFAKNTINVENLHGGKPWVEDYKHWSYEAAHRATARWRSSTSIDDGYMSTNDTVCVDHGSAICYYCDSQSTDFPKSIRIQSRNYSYFMHNPKSMHHPPSRTVQRHSERDRLQPYRCDVLSRKM